MTSRENIERAYDKINFYVDEPTSGKNVLSDFDETSKPSVVNKEIVKPETKRPESEWILMVKEHLMKFSIWIFLGIASISIGLLIAIYREIGEINTKQDNIISQVNDTSGRIINLDKDYSNKFTLIIERINSILNKK